MIFYLMGYWLRGCQYSHTGLKALCIALSVVSLFFFHSEVDIHYDSTYQGFWILYQVYSIALIVVMNNLFRLKIFQFPLLSSIGRDSMAYYCYHWILFHILVIIYDFPQNGISNYREFWTFTICSIIILPIIAYWRNLIKQRTIS